MGTARRQCAWIIGLTLVALAACAGHPSVSSTLERAATAAAAEDWAGAVDIYLDGPEDDRIADELSALTPVLLEKGVVLPVVTENALLRWLEGHDRHDLVSGVLTASVVDIPGGWTLMGRDDGDLDERPAREVWLDAYRIDRHEVTNLEFQEFVDRDRAPPPAWGGDRHPAAISTHPVLGVSWGQAAAFCEWSGGRLPSEAEWERACRGDTANRYPWGERWEPELAVVAMLPLDDLDDAWGLVASSGDPGVSPRRVGEPSSGATAEGVCNLAGNASEWVADWYSSEAYETLGVVNPLATGPEWNHVVRGGAWVFRADDPEALIAQSLCTARNSSHAVSDPRMGFRCAYEP